MLRYCFSQFRSKIINFKEKLFTLETNMEQADTLPLLNANLQAFLQEKVQDHLMVLKNYDHSQIFARLKQELIDNNNDLLLENTIKFLSLQMFNKQFIEEIEWLAQQPVQSEASQLLIMQFYSGIIVNNKKIFQQTNQPFNTLLVQIMDYSLNKKKQPQLSEDQLNQLREYLKSDNEILVCYASLFLSKYDNSITEFTSYNCYPEILLILLQEQGLKENQVNFILKQIIQSMASWHLYHFSNLFKYLQNLQPSPLLKELILKAYVQRIADQEGNTQFDFKVLKNFVQCAQQNEAIGDAQIYLKILERVSQLAIKHDYNRKQLNDVIRVVYFGIRALTFESENKFEDIPKLLLQNIELKQFLQEWLVQELTLESISIIGLFRLDIPKGFCLRYLTKLKLQEKHFRSVLRVLNQITYFELNDETSKIIIEMIKHYQIDYLRLIQPNILAHYPNIKPIVKAILATTTDDTIIEYICKNHQYIKNNKSICEQIGLDFSTVAPYIKFKIDAELTGRANIENVTQLLNAYDLIEKFDDNLIEKVKSLITQMTPSQVGQLLGACEQLRDKLKGYDQLQLMQGKNNFVDIYLNQKGELPQSIQSYDDIILANSLSQKLNYHKAKKLKTSLLEKLQTMSESPTPKQAYEIIMGWRAKDFEPKQYENYLKYIKDEIKNLDFHHIYKLVNKLLQQNQLNVGILLQAYLKLQNALQSNLNDQNDKVSILKLAIILKRIYPTLYLNLQIQETPEGELVNKIIENYYFDKGNQLQYQEQFSKYKQFLPLICDMKNIVQEYTLLEDQLQIAEYLYINNIKIKVNENHLLTALEQPFLSLHQLYKISCLVALQDDPKIFKDLLKSNYSRIDPFTNYLFQDDLVICFDVLKKLFPREPISKKLESIAIQTCRNFYEPTLTYLFTEGLLTNRTISLLENKCIETQNDDF